MSRIILIVISIVLIVLSLIKSTISTIRNRDNEYDLETVINWLMLCLSIGVLIVSINLK